MWDGPTLWAMDTKDIIRMAGGPLKVGQAVHRHHSTVCGWRKIPPCHALTIAQMAGVSVHVIRPDVFGPEQNREQAA